MSDLDVIKAMLERTGVVYFESLVRDHRSGFDHRGHKLSPDHHPSWDEPDPAWSLGAVSYVQVAEGEGARNLGYGGFASVFYFDARRRLVAVGAWE